MDILLLAFIFLLILKGKGSIATNWNLQELRLLFFQDEEFLFIWLKRRTSGNWLFLGVSVAFLQSFSEASVSEEIDAAFLNTYGNIFYGSNLFMQIAPLSTLKFPGIPS